MYLIIWEYHVKPECIPEFDSFYSPQGAWVGLFRKSAGYLGTELLHDETNPQRRITIDHWDSRLAYESFLEKWKLEYKALDEQCEGLTERETRICKGELK